MEEAARPANKGFLHENFRLFHLKDRRAQAVEPHYHEFDKAVVFYSGSVDYIVEGVTYRLQSGDILFVRHHDIHRPLISADSVYERAVLWIRPEFLPRYGGAALNLEACFDAASERRACLYRPSAEVRSRIRRLISELEGSLGSAEFGSALLTDTYFLQLLVEFNRCVLSETPQTPQETDPKIDGVIRHINNNLSEDLNIDSLAAMCYLSRYYFMRRFKEITGYTVHNYIQQKRLAAASELLDGGATITEAALDVGFSEYSSFLRAFKKAFSMTPSDYLMKRRGDMDSQYSE